MTYKEVTISEEESCMISHSTFSRKSQCQLPRYHAGLKHKTVRHNFWGTKVITTTWETNYGESKS